MTPVVPLKNYHTGYLADPNGLRDTPLVPEGTVADIWSHAVINFTKMVYHTDGRPKLGPLGTNAAYQRCIPIIYIYIY